MPASVARAQLGEVQRVAAAYAADETVLGVKQPPLPTQGIYWVAKDDGEPVGYAAGRLRAEGVLLGPIYVLPEHRRGGVALALLREVERWAQGTRVPVVEVSVAADNPAGIRFLESAGYETRRVLMARPDRPQALT